jgi:hypothetical protein
MSDPWTVHEPAESSAAADTALVGPSERVRTPRWIWMLVAGTVAVCLIAVVSVVAFAVSLDDDDLDRPDGTIASSGAMGPLLDRVQSSEGVMKEFQASYQTATSVNDVIAAAQQGSDALEVYRGQLVALPIEPTGGPVDEARTAYVAHVDEWIEAMESYADGQDSTNGDQIDSTFTTACESMRTAARDTADDAGLARIDADICNDAAMGADDGGPPGLQA